MSRTKPGVGIPPSAAEPTLSFAQLIESVGQRSRALAERATDAKLRPVAVAVRERGRTVIAALRDLADTERHLNAVQAHAAALAELGRDRPAAQPSTAPGAGTRTSTLRRISSIEVQLRLIRARAKGVDALEAEKQAIHRESGLGMPRISALLARTNGKHKASFARRALQSATGEARKSLAAELETLGFGEAAKLLRTARSEER